MKAAIDCYSIARAAEILGITYNSVRMRIYRGIYQTVTTDSRVVGVVKSDFWDVCLKHEQNGLIVLDKMPQAYRDERQIYAGDVEYTDNVLRGRRPSK